MGQEIMRVAVYYNNSDVRVEERPQPKVGPGELLVKVMASGICGSDVMEWYRVKKAPLVLGHEIAGFVVEAGPGPSQFRPGDWIVATHHVPCYSCDYCKDGNETVCDSLRSTNFEPGGFAELVRIPKAQVETGTLKLPEGVSFEEGTFVEPLACVVRGQRKAGMKKGKTIAVIGSGISGLLHVQLAKASGAALVIATDISGARLEMARKLGADATLTADEDVPARIRELNRGKGADIVIVCAAAQPAMAQAFRSADRGGHVLLFAPTKPGETVPLPLWELWRDCVTVHTSYAGTLQDMREALDIIAARKINVKDMITHRLPLAQIQEGFRLVAEAKDSMKVIIEPQK
ncbi:MAG: zinc-dependent dehydrogenase [Methanobacteriota archaeon]